LISLKKICIIIPYFGKWPKWFNYYLLSCQYNPTIDWHFFTDCDSPSVSEKNLFFHKMTLQNFNDLASTQLHMKTNVKHPYKVCDFKPAFGKIFWRFINNYDFWGYGDIDLIYGDIRNFITHDLLENYEVISPDFGFLPGHFSIIQNKPELIDLFLICDTYKKVFEDERCYCFDEKILRKGMKIDGVSLERKMKRKIHHHLLLTKIADNSMIKKLYGLSFKQIRHKIDKRKDKPAIRDFNDAINFYSSQNSYAVYRKTLYKSDIMKIQEKNKNWEILWKDGKLFDGDEEILYFHFQLSKFSQKFKIIDKIDTRNTFILMSS